MTDAATKTEMAATSPSGVAGKSSKLVLALGLLVCLGAGIGAGIGIGYGIWHGSSSSSSSSSLQGESCPEGQHADPLLTYFLTSDDVTVTPLNATEVNGVQGTFGKITFPRSSVPDVMPYVTNNVLNGQLVQEVLNTTQFLDDWIAESALFSNNSFAMPVKAAANQCFGKYQVDTAADTLNGSPTPPNAMIRFDSDPSNAVVVDIFDVRATEDGQGYVMIFKQVPGAAAGQPEKEGVCHPMQELSAPHYHHTSLCMDTILEWNVAESQVSGDGMVAFIKAVTGGDPWPVIETAATDIPITG